MATSASSIPPLERAANLATGTWQTVQPCAYYPSAQWTCSPSSCPVKYATPPALSPVPNLSESDDQTTSGSLVLNPGDFLSILGKDDQNARQKARRDKLAKKAMEAEAKAVEETGAIQGTGSRQAQQSVFIRRS